MANLSRYLMILMCFSVSGLAEAGSISTCNCKYEAISGDYALMLSTFNFDGKLVSTRKVGTYFGEQQCRRVASSAPACSKVTGGSQHCTCSYDVISGDYLLTRYIQDDSAKTVLSQKLSLFYSESACTNAALSLAACQ